MSLRTSFQKLIRPDAERPSLRERAAELRASISAPKAALTEPASSAPAVSVAGPAAEPDPALAVVTVFRASWDALGKVLDAEAPDELVAELEDAQGAAYDRLKVVRPTTPEGYRALAECWAMVLKGHRGDMPGMAASDHAADSLIAGAGACVPSQPVDWHNPPPGFMASPAIEPTNFALIPQGLQIELQRLRGIAWAEYHRLTENLRESMGEDEVRAHKDKVRAELFLPALTAAVDPGSTEAQVLAALGRPSGPDPVIALIEEHRAALAEWDRLSNVWNEMVPNAPGYAEAMAASDEPGKREVAACDALFTAKPATMLGVVALAEYLREATGRASAASVPSAAERGLSVVAGALRAVLATREERSRRETSLVGMLDLAAATMDELQTIRELADRVGGMAYAYAWRSSCHKSSHPLGLSDYNAAGKLMHWLGDALTDVETAVDKEAARRLPDNRSDRETRLSMLAVQTIDNGDPEEIEAFACELLAHAQVERGRG